MNNYLKKFNFYLVLSLSLILWGSKGIAEDMVHIFPIQNYDQRVASWVNVNDNTTPLISASQQALRYADFKSHLLGDQSPWSPDYVNQILHPQTGSTVQQQEEGVIGTFNNPANQNNPELIQYAENFHAYDLAGGPGNWLSSITNDMNLNQFANLFYSDANRAIATQNLLGRMLPTNDPGFQSYTFGGQGYPFDNLQLSVIWAGEPLYVLGTTLDGKWDLVLTSSFFAWVPDNQIAKASDDFISTWQDDAAQLIAVTQTATKVSNSNGQYLFDAYVGSVFPGSSTNQIFVPIRDPAGNAQIATATIPDNTSVIMPFAATSHNMGLIMQSLQGRPYGWGNMYYYNDCSAEMKSLFAPFGVWLPRNSADQPSAGKVVDETNASMNQRIAYLIQNGHKLVTMVYISGHVFLYTGNYKWGWSIQAMTYQNIWGLRPAASDSMTVYRAVIGGSVFLPLFRQYPEDTNLQSLADKSKFVIFYVDQMPTKSSTINLSNMARFPADDS